ncbi:hypothetical protein [Streptomyces sp. NBC_01439]|uniref:hypothetical protein n=1 Tax=Streptomyces sp. NBC_01439 TaxID=2903867 RepID=UPI003FCD8B4A
MPGDRVHTAASGAGEQPSFGVLVYYAIANASAWTLSAAEGRPARIIPVVGLAGCPGPGLRPARSSVITGAAVLAAGAAVYGIRRTITARKEK